MKYFYKNSLPVLREYSRDLGVDGLTTDLCFSVPLLNAAVPSISISGYDSLCVLSVHQESMAYRPF